MNLEEYLSPTKRRPPRTTAMLLWKHAWRLAKTIGSVRRSGGRSVGRVWEQDDVMAGDKKRDTFLTASNKLQLCLGLHHGDENMLIVAITGMEDT